MNVKDFQTSFKDLSEKLKQHNDVSNVKSTGFIITLKYKNVRFEIFQSYLQDNMIVIYPDKKSVPTLPPHQAVSTSDKRVKSVIEVMDDQLLFKK